MMCNTESAKSKETRLLLEERFFSFECAVFWRYILSFLAKDFQNGKQR